MTDYAQQSRQARHWTWIGLGLAVLALALMLAFAFASGIQNTGDSAGDNDFGIAHPQPAGVDDDVAGN